METTGVMPTTKQEKTHNKLEICKKKKRRLDHKEIHGQTWQTGIGITICSGELDKAGK